MITDNTGAKKIEGTDNWRLIFDAHNDSVDAHSEAIQKIEEGIAYRLGSTNTTGATLAVGTYVYVTGNTNGVADGMYKVSTAIVANGSLTTSNLTAVSGGIGNELNSKITNLHFVRSGSSIEKHTTGTVSVPCDGIVAVTARATANGELLMRASTEFGEIILNANALAGVYSQVSLPCKKNDTITITNVSNVSTCYFSFYAFAY